ncbi:hypothetical protein PTKIN_Ptkin02bG0070800 [Pterospermum kingtungense]
MRNALVKAWKVSSNLDIREIGKWLFLFTFSPSLDRVKLHGIPLNLMSSKIDIALGDKIGDVEEVDAGTDNRLTGKRMRIRVTIDVSKPLRKG